MNYIIFDMEWNQSSAENVKVPELSHGEIIQIGFMVLNEQLEILHREKLNIKPVCYTVMNKYVCALTGISQSDIDCGISFDSAVRRMAEFFGEETVIITWGDDDLPVLNENLKFHKISDIKLPPHYNLQRIFSMQTGSGARQTGLKTAIEHFNIEIDIQAHDALNDAYMTVLVARCLDIKKGISEYNDYKFPSKDKSSQQPWRSEQPLSSDAFPYTGNADGMGAFCGKIPVLCPVCSSEAEREAICRHGKSSFISAASCPEHGRFFLRYVLTNGIITLSCYKETGDFERIYRNRLRQREKRLRYKEIYKKSKTEKR